MTLSNVFEELASLNDVGSKASQSLSKVLPSELFYGFSSEFDKFDLAALAQLGWVVGDKVFIPKGTKLTYNFYDKINNRNYFIINDSEDWIGFDDDHPEINALFKDVLDLNLAEDVEFYENGTMPTKQKKLIVTIVYDSKTHKLKAQADDGVHGMADVIFPSAWLIRSGLQFKVDQLIWNGKNYEVSGKITPLPNTDNQNIFENKETPKMNFYNIFEELDQLYESDALNAGVDTKTKVCEALTDPDQSDDPSVNRAIDPTAKWEKVLWKELNTGDIFMYNYQPDRWFKDGKFVGPLRGEKPYSLTVQEADVEKLQDSSTKQPFDKYIERKGQYYCGNAIVDCNNNPIGDVSYLPSELTVYKLVESLTEAGEDAEETPGQVVLECANCGALSIHEDSDFNTDEKTGLIDLDEPCGFCEENEGFKAIGTFIPNNSDTASEAAGADSVESFVDDEDETVVEESCSSTKTLNEAVNYTDIIADALESANILYDTVTTIDEKNCIWIIPEEGSEYSKKDEDTIWKRINKKTPDVESMSNKGKKGIVIELNPVQN